MKSDSFAAFMAAAELPDRDDESDPLPPPKPPFWAFVLRDATATTMLDYDPQLDRFELGKPELAELLEPPEDGLWFWEGDVAAVPTGTPYEPDVDFEEKGRFARATVKDLANGESPEGFESIPEDERRGP